MADAIVTQATHSAANPATYHPTAGASFPIGTVVRPSPDDAGIVLPSDDSDVDSAAATGLAAGPGIEGLGLPVQYAGSLALTAAEWDVLSGQSGGLTTGSRYFAAPSGGGIRTTGSTNFTTCVGVALSPTEMLVQISSPRPS
jgi:hypothetical protein